MSENCTPKSRCKKFRTCEVCARIRQKRVADLAVSIFEAQPDIHAMRFTPYDQSHNGIIRLKTSICRGSAGKSHLWTIELGEMTKQLHLNYLSTEPLLKQIKNCESWQTQRLTDLRSYAAYIVKQSQIPPIEVYSGRQYGGFKSISKLLISSDMPPIVQALAHETITLKDYIASPNLAAVQKLLHDPEGVTLSYKEIADKHLFKLQAYVRSFNGRDKM